MISSAVSGQEDKITNYYQTLFSLLFLLFSSTAIAEQKPDLQLERFEQALDKTPNIENGKQVYRVCLTCHGPEGWGTQNGSYPQIAGQLTTVTIKQLEDICSKNRSNPIMEAFTSPRVMQTAQDVADLAAYIAQLPMTDNNGQGNQRDISQGKKIYADNCKNCHGEKGEGHLDDHIPKIQAQHYHYLMRQFSWIRNGHRHNADKKMVKQIQNFSLREETALMSYVASLKPAKELQAKPGWTNPDFPEYDRQWLPGSPRLQPLN